MASKRRYVLSGRILIVGEPVDTASTLAVLCQLYGAEVRTVASSAEALQVGDEFRPDVVLASVAATCGSKQEFPRQVRAKWRDDEPILIGLVDANNRREIAAAGAAGFDAHLARPVEIDALVSLLAELRAGG